MKSTVILPFPGCPDLAALVVAAALLFTACAGEGSSASTRPGAGGEADGGSPSQDSGSDRSEQLKFASGHMMATYNSEYGSGGTWTGSGPYYGRPLYEAELAVLKKYHTGFVGYVMCATHYQLENHEAATNLALTPAASGGAAGATGTALQAAINTQYPGFKAQIEKQFYYQQAVLPGDLFGIIINAIYLSPGGPTWSVITQDWSQPNVDPVVPKDVRNCNGSITVPNSYGSTQTTTYAVAPIYKGSNGFGFGFGNYSAGYTGSPTGTVGAFTLMLPAWWNPGINQRTRIQMWQALSMYQLSSGTTYSATTAYAVGQAVSYTDGHSYICIAPTTGNAPPNTTYWMLNTFAGKTLDQIPLIVKMWHNDEYSFALQNKQNITNAPGYSIVGFDVNPPYLGSTSYPASKENMFAGHQAFMAARIAAFPHTPQVDCFSWGYGGTDLDSSSDMAGHTNNLMSANGLSAMRGWTMSTSDTLPNTWGLHGQGAPQASWAQTGFIGNTNPTSLTSIPFNHVPQYDLTGKADNVGQVQVGDFDDGTSLYPRRTQAAVNGIIESAIYMGSPLMIWSATDATYIIDPTSASASWQSYIQPAVAASLSTQPLPSALPLYMMYGPAITSIVVNSSTSITINWSAITGQGTGLSIVLYRNGTQIASGAAATFTTYTDTGLAASTAYTYTLAMQNAAGYGGATQTGPQGAGATATTK